MSSVEDNAQTARHTGHFLRFSKVKKLQYYDWWKKLIDLLQKNLPRTYNNIWKMTAEQEDDYATGCLLDYRLYKAH